MSVLSDVQSEFLEQINDDVRDYGLGPNEKRRPSDQKVYDALRSPENLERWILALKKMKRDSESQLVAKRAERAEARVKYLMADNKEGYLKYIAENERWRANNIRFKNGVESKLDEAMTIRDSEIEWLRDAIVSHKDSIEASDLEDDTSSFDEELWSCVA